GSGRDERFSRRSPEERCAASRLPPHPEERCAASRLEGWSRALRPIGARWSAPSAGSGRALRGPFGAPQGEGNCAPHDGEIAMSDPVIQSLVARRIWDSRGRPTVEAEIALSDG